MSVNFAEILSGATLGEIEKPKPLPVGSYAALVKSVTFDQSKGEKKTPFVQVELEITQPLDDVNEVDLEEFGGIAKLQGKRVKTKFFLSDAALFMLQEFILVHIGLDLKGMTLDQALPQVVNNQVGVRIKHRPDDKKPDVIYAEVENTFALS